MKQKRVELGLSHADSAYKLNVSEGFIGNIENPNYPEKYNLRHLNELVKLFKHFLRFHAGETIIEMAPLSYSDVYKISMLKLFSRKALIMNSHVTLH